MGQVLPTLATKANQQQNTNNNNNDCYDSDESNTFNSRHNKNMSLQTIPQVSQNSDEIFTLAENEDHPQFLNNNDDLSKEFSLSIAYPEGYNSGYCDGLSDHPLNNLPLQHVESIYFHAPPEPQNEYHNQGYNDSVNNEDNKYYVVNDSLGSQRQDEYYG